MTTRNGYALPLTLAAIIVIALVAAIAAEQVRSSTRTISALSDQVRSRTALISAEQTLIYEMLTEPMALDGIAIGSQSDVTLLAMGSSASNAKSSVVSANGSPYQIGQPTPVIIRLYDDQAFLNAASSDPAYISDILSLFGVPRTDHARYAATLRDYQDEDDLRTLSGAEASDYDQPGLPTNKPLRDALELCAIKYWEDSPVCDDAGRLLLTMRARRTDRINPRLTSEALLDLMMPEDSPETITEAHANFATMSYTRFAQIGADAFDIVRDPLSTLNAPGPILTLITHTPDAGTVQRTVIELTPNSLISPFVVHSKYAIGGDYTQNILRIENSTMSRRFPKRPQSLLSARRGVERRGGPAERLILGERVVISRALCHFETMNALPGGQSLRRYEAAKLGARARTPIADPEFYFDWGDDQIGVWSWPKSLTADLTEFEGEILPETVLHPPLQEGARLMTTIDGYEGQVWRDGQLRASRWWPSQPGDSDWASFLRMTRSAGADQIRPAPSDLVLTDRPAHAQPYTALLDRVKSISLRDITALALVCIAVPGLYLLGQWAQLSRTHAAASAELAALSEETAEIGTARLTAQSASNELALYAQALNRRHPAQLLASVSEELARFSIRLDAFEQNDGLLSLNLHAEGDFAPEALVRTMENNPLMNSVSLEPGRGRGEWLLTAQLESAQ